MAKNFVYLIKSSNNNYKIGISRNPHKRLKELQTGNPFKLEIIHIFESLFHNKLEKTLHRTFAHLHDIGEWYFLTDDEENDFLSLCQKIEKTFIFLKENENFYFNK